MINAKKLLNFSNKKILVIGDVMLDRYSYGDVTRLSVEAPVPIFKKTRDLYTLGGAANVANNLQSLGAKVSLVGIIGNDENGRIFHKLLADKKIDDSLVITDNQNITTTKHRIVAKTQQLLRIDEEEFISLTSKIEKQIWENVSNNIAKSDTIILSDYAKGFFNETITSQIIKKANKLNKIIIVDCKPQNKALFKNVTLVKPNLIEAKAMSGKKDLQEIGKELVTYFNASVAVTCGREGINFYGITGDHFHIDGRKIDVYDVSGAGDTVTAVLALGLAADFSMHDALYMANYAGGMVVQKIGTATITLDELASVAEEDKHIDNVDIVPKLWGYEKWIENNERYCSKLLFVKKGYQCSLHYHKIKDEMFIVSSGHIRLEVNDKVVHLHPGNFYRIPPMTKHRFRGIEDSTMIEVSTQHMEEDSYRVEESRKVEDIENEQ